MMRLVKVLRRVLVLRRIATPDVSAAEAQPEVNPLVAELEAILAAGRVRRDIPDF
jgi:hypothetical protein